MKFGAIVLSLSLFLIASSPVSAQDGTVQMGIANSMVLDLSPGQKKFIDSEFVELVKEFTGMPAKLDQGHDYVALAKKVQDGAIQLGIFQGIEVAWATKLHSELKPLMIARYKETLPHVYLVCKKEGGPANLDALKGKNVGWLKQGREHCHVFLTQKIQSHAKTTPDKFFGKIVIPTDGESSLDDVLLGNTDAVVVDETAFAIYKDVNPGRFKRLTVLAESVDFPRAAIVYNSAKVPAAVVEKFRNGMFKANASARGQEVMGTFKISAFEDTPPAYLTSLGEILKTYPLPEKK